MTYLMKPRNSREIVVVNRADPTMQFRIPHAAPPQLLVTEAGDHLALLERCADGPGRWAYEPVEPVEVEIPPAYVMENRAPCGAELDDMDPAERADWEERTRDTPSLEPQPLPSEY